MKLEGVKGQGGFVVYGQTSGEYRRATEGPAIRKAQEVAKDQGSAHIRQLWNWDVRWRVAEDGTVTTVDQTKDHEGTAE